jgi:heme-degrading monooxygenase HmoA
MYVGIRRYKIRQGCQEKLVTSVTNFLPIVESLPGFKYYHLYNWPKDHVTVINAFDVEESVTTAHAKALDWVHQHAGNIVEGRPEVSSCTVLVLA